MSLNFLYDQVIRRLPYPTTSVSGKTFIVTGSNIGLGLEAARHFVRLDAAKVIIAVRSTSKGEEAKQSIESSTGRKGVVEVWPLDLGSYDSVKAFAEKAKKLDRIDSLVENAGIATRAYTLMEENESQITVNVVSTFLLALLLPPLKFLKSILETPPSSSTRSTQAYVIAALLAISDGVW